VTDVVVVGSIAREIDVGAEGVRSRRLAGSGLLAALVAQRLGAKTALAGFVGEDDLPTLRELADAVGVDTSAVITVPGASPQFVFSDATGAGMPHPAFRPSEWLPTEAPELPRAAAVLVFGIPGFDCVARGWLGSADLRDSMVVWDRQGWLSAARDSTAVATLPCARRLQLTKLDELGGELGTPPDVHLLARLPLPGFHTTVIKNGPWGSEVFTADGERHAVPAFDVVVKRSVGSGDAYAGALTASIARGSSIVDGVTRATAVAASMIADDVSPPPADLEDRARRLAETTPRSNVRLELLHEVQIELRAAVRSPAGALGSAAIKSGLDALGLKTHVVDNTASHAIVVSVTRRGEPLWSDVVDLGATERHRTVHDVVRQVARVVREALAVQG
jgi:sugar/nucleoside kinase (ribokinase family)